MSRTLDDVVEPAETLSPAEERFTQARRLAGLLLAPAAMLAILAAPLGLPPAAQRLAAVIVLMFVLWVTEALPLAVTAILGPTLAILLRIAPAREAFAPFADPIIFLFIGSFVLAQAMYVHRLDRRIAFAALSSRGVGDRPVRIVVVFGAVAAAISMWISNTATAAMLYPVGMSVVSQLARSGGRPGLVGRFGTSLMLMTAFAASVGGVATPIGTPPNLIGIGMLRTLGGVRITFTQWMALGVPVMLVLYGFLALWFAWLARRTSGLGEGSGAHVREELARLGPMSPGERNVLAAFGVTVLLWVLPGILSLAGAGETAFAKAYGAAVPESVAAMVGALLLFLLPAGRSWEPTLAWEDAVRIDWGTILLFGGGLSIGALAFSTGLADALGRGVAAWLPVRSTFGYTALFTGLGVLLSETTSNTAAASMLVPVAIAVSHAAGIRVIEPALGATLGASMGFMLPISTPPNAIAYSSGYVRISAMMRSGILLDLVGFVVIVAAVTLIAPALF